MLHRTIQTVLLLGLLGSVSVASSGEPRRDLHLAALDPDTGRLIWRVKDPLVSECEFDLIGTTLRAAVRPPEGIGESRVLWLDVRDGSPVPEASRPRDDEVPPRNADLSVRYPVGEQGYVTRPGGATVFGPSGRPVWSVPTTEKYDWRSVCAADGRVFFALDPAPWAKADQGVRCYKVGSSTPEWTIPVRSIAPDRTTWLGYVGLEIVDGQLVAQFDGLIWMIDVDEGKVKWSWDAWKDPKKWGWAGPLDGSRTTDPPRAECVLPAFDLVRMFGYGSRLIILYESRVFAFDPHDGTYLWQSSAPQTRSFLKAPDRIVLPIDPEYDEARDLHHP